MTIIIIFFISHWYLSLFSQSFLQHRYASHGAFTMNRFWERFFYIFAYITQGSSYMSPRAYAVMHRMHHAYADTPKDPHSPKNNPNFFKMMWQTKLVYADIMDYKFDVEERFTKNLPQWHSLDIWGQTLTNRLMFFCLYTSVYVMFAPYWWLYFLIPFHVFMGPVHASIVNWCAHKYGHRSYDMKNTSRNFLPVDFLMLGEDYHNNHHKFPSSANFGVKWYEIDPLYYIMLGLEFVGIIKIKNKGKHIETEY